MGIPRHRTLAKIMFNRTVKQSDCLFAIKWIFGSLPLYPPYSKKGGHGETLLNACIAHSNSADLLLSNNASDWLSGDFDKKEGGRLYSRPAITQNKFIAEPNLIVNCDLSLSSPASFE